jgi:hypothetical protein
MSSIRSADITLFEAKLDRLQKRAAAAIAAQVLTPIDLSLYLEVLKSGARSPIDAFEDLRAFNSIPIVRLKYTNTWMKRKLFKVWWAIRLRGMV